jgi:hypothetical protein
VRVLRRAVFSKPCNETSSRLFRCLLSTSASEIGTGCDGGTTPATTPAAIVHDEARDFDFVMICERCHVSLKKRKTPKFSLASGYVVAEVPRELAVLNDMELRTIGLGIYCTPCYNLRGSGQECSRGNTINYWNDACELISTLPARPQSVESFGFRLLIVQMPPICT